MHAFIEKNRKLLVFYYWVTRSGGWIFLVLSTLAIAGHSFALATRISTPDEFQRYYHHDVPWGMLNNILPTGILALGISQLIKYLLDIDNNRPGWILRNSSKLLYIYAAILIGYYCWACVNDIHSRLTYEPQYVPLSVIFLAIFMIVKLFVLIGAAEIARRAIPVLEESKTLV